ncbi:hypothetical protein AAF143_13780 [Cyanobium sp. ATX-6F1]|uniref:hypothetical protein n=1 Tax=Cyanobium sp. ATX 6F1 TaxID=2823702 RepID=UPI0020CF92A3|nr:hypothetical protein [Cyanobium sp. ATX 6F1]MCP9915543.1 hypothetical protein [Cyanobium sp. ATX 6F1]
MPSVSTSASATAEHAFTNPQDALHRIRELAHSNRDFANSLRHSHSTEEAAELAGAHGISIKPEVLWRHRGTLLSGGLPTWPG